MKLLSIAVPCYNSQDYMRHCVETLLSGGEDVEILIVDDGSKDDTAAIADELAKAHPAIVRAIHQENAGHGGAVMTGIRNATGLYFKVVDSDDWVDEAALGRILSVLRGFSQMKNPVDLLISNYIYDKVGVTHKKVIRYGSALPRDKVITWDDAGSFQKGQYLLMHALIYRTALLRECGLELPKHTFYVDNLFAYVPLASVERMYYLDVDLYHYYIGREDQSVQENTMIRRIDQQLRVNRLMLTQVDLHRVGNKKQFKYLFNYLEIVTAISTVMLTLSNTPEHQEKKRQLWADIRAHDPWVYDKLRHGLFGTFLNLPGKGGRRIAIGGYRISQKIFGFN